MLDMIFILLFIMIPFVVKAAIEFDACEAFGHQMQRNGNAEICIRCGIMRKKIKK